MTSADNHDPNDEIRLGDVFRPIVLFRRQIWQGSLAIALVVLVVGGLYFVFQPTSWTARLGFRPTFDGAQEGRYPNGLPFAATDVIAPSVVDAVASRNRIHEFCEVETFRNGIAVQEDSPAAAFLTLDYQARLSDARLTPIERQRIEEEYRVRRTTLPREIQLTYLQPIECAGIPREVIFKSMGELLETWAQEADQKRGVMKMRIPTLSPSIFDHPGAADEPLLVRADLARSAILRVISNIGQMEQLPGAELIRVGDDNLSLSEVRSRLEDLTRARLDPLIGVAGSGLGRQSIRWVEQALQSASAQLRSAEQRAESYRMALREYSGLSATPSASAATDRAGGSTDVQALTPQIDRTFIDGIVQLSETNTRFRQEITRQMIAASVDAVNKAATVGHYRSLLDRMTGGGGEPLSAEDVTRRLAAIITEAKDATRRFNEIYEEFSRVSIRVGGAMYRIEDPPTATTARSFTLRNYATSALAAMVLAPVLLAVLFLIQYHVGRFVRRTLAG